MRIKRQSRKWKDIDCNNPDDHEQFDGCGADDVGKDKDEKWICPCRGCSRVINPKWTLKCGHGPEDHIDLTGNDCIQRPNRGLEVYTKFTHLYLFLLIFMFSEKRWL